MTDKEQQQQKEIERLQRKIKNLTEAYNQKLQELNELKKAVQPKERGRIGIAADKKRQILALRRQGCSMREIAGKVDVAVGTVHKVINEAKKKSRIVYVYMDREMPATVIDTCQVLEEVSIVNLTNDMISRAFGVCEHPVWNDFETFMEERCMPRTRYGIREELKDMGLDIYDPFQIVEKTKGRVYGDSQWIRKLKSEEVKKYDEIMKNVKSVSERTNVLREFFRYPEGEHVWLR